MNAMIDVSQRISDLYNRTLENCLFYEKEGSDAELLNEIGVLRGIAYCMEAAGMSHLSEDFIRLIEKQQELKGKTQD